MENILRKYKSTYHPVVDFDPAKDKLLEMDFTSANKDLTSEILDDTAKFSAYIQSKIESAGCRYGIGGYNELRTVYARSKHFDSVGEPRRLHLGVDIWGAAGTPVYAFMGGQVQSFAFNDNYGDYGATLILLHQLDGMSFYTLYGHISLRDIATLNEGDYMIRGQRIAHFGEPHENGHWPPHLHFQVILELGVKKGDYPGVCKFSERKKYLANCPDPNLILQGTWMS